MINAAQPAPQGLYTPATRHGDLIFTAGMTPRKNGVLQFKGPVCAIAEPALQRDAIELACRNALAAVQMQLAQDEHIAGVISLTVYISAEPGFTAHSRLADLASEFFRSELGERGIGSRAAVGVASLPGDAPVEIQLVAAV